MGRSKPRLGRSSEFHRGDDRCFVRGLVAAPLSFRAPRRALPVGQRRTALRDLRAGRGTFRPREGAEVREAHHLLARTLDDASQFVTIDPLSRSFAGHAFGNWPQRAATFATPSTPSSVAFVAGRPTLGILAPTCSASVDNFLKTLGRSFAAAKSNTEIVVFGACLDDLAIMAAGSIFVTGAVSIEEYDRLLVQYCVGWLLSPYRTSHFWLFNQRLGTSHLPKAYFDWSFGTVAQSQQDLALDPKFATPRPRAP